LHNAHLSAKDSNIFLSKYLSKIEIFGWLLCMTSMLIIILAKEIAPEMLPYAWIGAICGAGMIGWGMARKHRK
jgi:hypothetical protein